MNTLTYQPFYRRHLPHIQPPGATLFITFRLKDSIPQALMEELRNERDQVARGIARLSDPQERARRTYLEERRLFGKWDAALHACYGPRWLQDARLASVVVDSLHYRDGKEYDLHVFCLMPNHVHLVCTPLIRLDGTYYSMSKILHSLKGYTAYQANRLLGRRGAFWQDESYDHVVRDESEMRRIAEYVLNNPVKAGLVAAPEEWLWSYVADGLGV